MINAARIIGANADRTYLVGAGDGRVLTYAGLGRAALNMADWLKENGLERGDRLALFMPNCLELACTYYACLFGGIVAVPVNAKYSLADREYMLATTGAKACLCNESTRGLVPDGFAGHVLTVAGESRIGGWILPADDGESLELPYIDYDALFTITFTSGTTGRPKGICHSARTHLTNAEAFNRTLRISSDHRFYHSMPMTYMAGILNNLFCPFAAGASVVVGREFDALMSLDFWTPFIRHKANCMWLSPSVLTLLLQMDRGTEGEAYCRESVKFVASCTAPLPVSVKEDFEARYGCPVLPSFGLSETLINTIDSPDDRCSSGSCGRPLPTVDFAVINDNGSPCAPGEIGDMSVRSQGQMLGYLDPITGQPDTLPRYHWFPTGDMGSIDDAGCVHVTDRRKDIIIRGGINISPAKIEDVLSSQEGVGEAAVIGLPDPVQGERVAAALLLDPGYSGDKAELLRVLKLRCSESLESIAVPEVFMILADFPKSPTGKVKKAELRKQMTEA